MRRQQCLSGIAKAGELLFAKRMPNASRNCLTIVHMTVVE